MTEAAARIREQVLSCIDSLLHPLVLLDILPLKSEAAIELIAEVMEQSGKTAREAVLVFIAALRYLSGGSGWDLAFIRANARELSKIAVEKRVQANHPGRALPLLEVLGRRAAAGDVFVLELGAAAGVLGRVLLNPEAAMKNKDRYFPPGQQLPVAFRPASRYLGLDLDPPDEPWLLACVWDGSQRKRLERFLRDAPVPIPPGDRFELIEADAFGFPALDAVKEMAHNAAPGSLWVVTSFLLYQYGEARRKQLENVIRGFTRRHGGHWINQRFNGEAGENRYSIQLNGETVMRLPDDLCRSWEWIR